MTVNGAVAEVLELRRQGLTPKRIARSLGLRPAEVLAVLRLSTRPEAATGEPPAARCWLSSGWAQEVRVHGHPDWPGLDEVVESPGGLVCVLVARRHRYDKVAVCGYLVDVHCLGVKSAMGPTVMTELDLVTFRRQFFGAYQGHVPVPFELARQLVLGGVEYARGLGLEPHPDFADTAAHLDGPLTHCDVEFGRDGMPFYVEGPYDDAEKVMHSLETSVGAGNYHYLRTIGLSVTGGAY